MDEKFRGLKAIDEITDILIKYELSDESVFMLLDSIKLSLRLSRLNGFNDMFVKEEKDGKKKKSRK